MKKMSWGQFLKDRSTVFASLRNWKEAGSIVVWMHTNTAIYKRLLHIIPYVETEESGKQQISFLYFVCHEDIDDYERKIEPSRCPICRTIDFLMNSNIDPGELVWQAEAGDRKRDRVCTLADFTGNVDAGGDWRLSFKPSRQYVMAVIDDDNVDNGIVVTAEKYSLGQSIQKTICQRIDSAGEEIGDPSINPYAIKWVFDSNATKSTDYYQAYAYEKAKLTDEIRELLNEPEQDISHWVNPGDANKLYEVMNQHIIHEAIDIDEMFDNVIGGYQQSEKSEPVSPPVAKSQPKPKSVSPPITQSPPKQKPASPPVVQSPPQQNNVQSPTTQSSSAACIACQGTGQRGNARCPICQGTGQITETFMSQSKTRQTRQVQPALPPEPIDEEELYECQNCGKDVKESDDTCPHCGEDFS